MYTVFFFLVLAGIIAWMGYRIHIERYVQTASAEVRFENLKKTIQSSYGQEKSFNSEAFKETVKKSVANDRRLQLLVVYSHDTGIEYVLARNSAYLKSPLGENVLWEGTPRFSYRPIPELRIKKPLSIPGAPGYAMDGIYKVLTNDEVFFPIRDALVAVCALIVATGIFILLISLIGKEDKGFEKLGAHEIPDDAESAPVWPRDATAVRETVQETQKPLAETWETHRAAEPPKEPERRIVQGAQAAAGNAQKPEEPAHPDEKNETHPETPLKQEVPSSTAAEGNPVVQEEFGAQEQETADKPAPEETAKGLFSPATGLGWQEYLEKRLTMELERSASFDQDMVLALIRVKGLDAMPNIYREIAQKILESFAFQDLAFEYKNDGFAVIIPNIDLDQAMKKMETFSKKIQGSLPCEAGCVVKIGLSSRNGRLASGNRVLLEADRALQRSESEPGSQIIAFRPDPDKFRNFIASQA